MCVNPLLTTYPNLNILSQGKKKSYQQKTHLHNIFRHSVEVCQSEKLENCIDSMWGLLCPEISLMGGSVEHSVSLNIGTG